MEFEPTKEENDSLRSQIGTLKRGEHSKYLPFVFTEQGVAMLSSVLNSTKAISVNIQIIRIFSRIRQMLTDNTELRLAIEKLITKTDNNTKNIELGYFSIWMNYQKKKIIQHQEKKLALKSKHIRKRSNRNSKIVNCLHFGLIIAPLLLINKRNILGFYK